MVEKANRSQESSGGTAKVHLEIINLLFEKMDLPSVESYEEGFALLQQIVDESSDPEIERKLDDLLAEVMEELDP